jgi:hypothetical protein
MSIAEKLLISKVLIDELEFLILDFRPNSNNLPQIIKRAYSVKLNMQKFYIKNNQPEQLLEQLERMDSVIKKLESMQEKHVID